MIRLFLSFLFLALVHVSVSPAAALTVINAGVGGNSSADLLERLEEDVLSREPDLVILMVGTNDALNSRKLSSPAAFEANLASLIAEIIESGSRLLIMTIPPCHSGYLLARHSREAYGGISPDERVLALNQLIRKAGDRPAVQVVDIHALFKERGGASELPASLIRNETNSGVKDGVHPTAEGYAVIAEALHEALAGLEWVGDRSTVVCLGDSITYGAGMKKAGKAGPDSTSYPGQLFRLLDP
ncbi:MAG: GDSL-type esterase/lipase family protein [Verrucomicrobiales bacterium]|nr:GDSL-type esterase/lipase family protein [Verrucomicrobiales bacterium]